MAQLPNTATIKQIITALQEMQAINQKADLVSVIGSPAVSTDDVATIITKLQSAKNTLAANLTAQGQTALPSDSLASLASKVTAAPVRRWASGTGSFRYSSTDTTHRVSGLAFTPVLVVVDVDYGFPAARWENTIFVNSNGVPRVDYITFISKGFTFLCPGSGSTSLTNYYWIAVE